MAHSFALDVLIGVGLTEVQHNAHAACDLPWILQGIVMRNRHLDVKGLFSHSYASEVFKSRTQIVGFIEVGVG